MKILFKFMEFLNSDGYENYCDFSRRWEKNRQELSLAKEQGEVIRLVSQFLKDGESARFYEQNYLTITGPKYKYTTRIYLAK